MPPPANTCEHPVRAGRRHSANKKPAGILLLPRETTRWCSIPTNRRRPTSSFWKSILAGPRSPVRPPSPPPHCIPYTHLHLSPPPRTGLGRMLVMCRPPPASCHLPPPAPPSFPPPSAPGCCWWEHIRVLEALASLRGRWVRRGDVVALTSPRYLQRSGAFQRDAPASVLR